MNALPIEKSISEFREFFESKICDLTTDQYLRNPALTEALTPLIREHFERDTETVRQRLRQPLRGNPAPGDLRVCLTNHALDNYAGSELWTSDVAKFMVGQGIPVLAYSSVLGNVSDAMIAAGVRATSSIEDVIDFAPTILHVNHFRAAEELIGRLNGSAAVINMIHGLLPRPGMPGYAGVDCYACASIASKAKTHRLTGVPWDAIELHPNFFDEERFRAVRNPGHSGKALLFSSKTPPDHRERLRRILAPLGFFLDHIGYGAQSTSEPEKLLPRYEVVFATGRSAIEAVASGCRVILWDCGIVGPIVVSANFWACVLSNFSSPANVLPWRYIEDADAEAWIVEQLAASGDSTNEATALTRRHLVLANAGLRLLAMYDRERSGGPT